MVTLELFKQLYDLYATSQNGLIQTPQSRPVLRQFGQSAKQAMTRVSILAFDLFPWRQSRMKLAKTLQMGQTPWWVKWTHLDACTHICRNRPEVPSFRSNWPANTSRNQKESVLVDSEEVAQHPLCVLPVCAYTVCLWQRHRMDFDLFLMGLHGWWCCQCHITNPPIGCHGAVWRLAGQDLYVSHYVFHFL